MAGPGPRVVLDYELTAPCWDRWPLVVLAGLTTTSFTVLWALLACARLGLFPSEVRLWGIAPIGAFFLGLVAAWGYWAVAGMSRVRIGGGRLAAIVSVTIAAYVATQYLAFMFGGRLYFSGTSQPVSFWRYYDYNTRNSLVTSSLLYQHDPARSIVINLPGYAQPAVSEWALGWMGYGVRLLELICFCFGTLITPVLVSRLRFSRDAPPIMDYQ